MMSDPTSELKSPKRMILPRLGNDRYYLPLLLLALADGSVFAASIWLAYPIRFYSWVSQRFPIDPSWEIPPFGTFFKFGLLAALVGVVVFERLGFYQHRIGTDRRVHIFRIVIGVLLANLILQILLTLTATSLSRGTRLIAFCLTIPLAVFSHYFLKHAHHSMIRQGFGYRRTLLLAESEQEVGSILSELERECGSEFQISGILLRQMDREPQTLPTNSRGVVTAPPQFLGDLKDLRRTLATGGFDTVLILFSQESVEAAKAVIPICEQFEVEFFLDPGLFERILGDIPIGGDVLLPVLARGETPLSGSALAVKRVFDLVGSACLILVCLPFWTLLAIAIKLGSKGPVFYGQERIGHDGRCFKVLKFRSMRVGAESDTGPVWAVQDDPRRTRLGGWMRKYNIDETPQFLNVFRGEMSLVGPRPERPHFVNQFKLNIPSYIKRHMVKSGITGWAQVHGLRGDTSIEERTRYDMWYIRNWSLLLDIKILLKTFSTGEHAY